MNLQNINTTFSGRSDDLGRELVKLTTKGCKVGVAYYNTSEEKTIKLFVHCQEFGREVMLVQEYITTTAKYQEIAKKVHQKRDNIYLPINNAAITKFASISSQSK